MNRIFMIFLVAVFCPTWAPADLIDYCKSKWPDDPSLQEHCVLEQNEGSQKIAAFTKANNMTYEGIADLADENRSDAERILSKCAKNWDLPEFDTVNFKMTAFCVEQRVSEYNDLNSVKIPLGFPASAKH